MMKIVIAGIKTQLGASLPFELLLSPLQLELAELAPWVRGEITAKGLVTNTGNGLQIKGRLSIPATFNCNACLVAVEKILECSFAETFHEGAGTEEAEADWLFFQGDEIDIGEMLREHIVLSEPLKPVCREDCRGLCPRCGINLNQDSCTCERKSVDPRLAGLEKLLK